MAGASEKVDIFMPIYIGDYLKDTTFLTTEQHGAYLLLMFALWQHDGAIPFQESALCLVTKLDSDAWRNAWSMLEAYFDVEDGKLVQHRLSKELMKAKGNKKKAHKRAKTAAKARWSSKKPMLKECPSPTTTPTEDKNKQLVIDSFEECWEMYRRKGTKASALKYWKKHKQEDRDAIKAKIPAYVASVSAKKYQKDFEKWINPTNRMWENEVEGESTESVAMTPEDEAATFKDYWK